MGTGAESHFIKFDISVDAVEVGDEIDLICAFNRDLFERSTVGRLLAVWERVLEQIAESADVRISQLSLVSEAERALVVEAWNRRRGPIRGSKGWRRCSPSRWRDAGRGGAGVGGGDADLRGARTRGRISGAATCSGWGVGPETRVGVLLERGRELVVALLGVIKAGGAYVPLDPANRPSGWHSCWPTPACRCC